MQHRAKSEEEKEAERRGEAVPRICMDYGYMSKKDEEEQKNPFLIAVDETTGERYARMAGAKGVGEN